MGRKSKIYQVKHRVTVVDRSGKRKILVPLSVGRAGGAPAPKKADSVVSDDHDSSLGAGASTATEFEGEFISKHARRLRNKRFNWDKTREQLVDAFLEEQCFLQGATSCSNCSSADAITRCRFCGPRQFFCMVCARNLHSTRNQFHVLDLWQDGCFIPLYPDHGVLGYGHECPTKINRIFTLVDAYGNHHIKYVEVCSCESAAVTLIRCNFWPGSPEKPTVAFHMDLMKLCEKLFLQSQVSLYDFVEVIKAIQPALQPSVLTSLYGILNSGCFEEFRQFHYQLRYLNKLVGNGLDDGTKCPLCPQGSGEGTIIQCMDACMGLARKKAKGEKCSVIEPRHGTLFFYDQDDVDNFVNSYSATDSEQGDRVCNRFHAGEVLPALRSKGKNKLFDEKGVFGCVCRHDFPTSFLNLKFGERISYSVYELRQLKENLSPDINLIIMYDIACILDRHLQGTNQGNLLDNVGLSIPIFHCYGHKASCQVKYSPRRTVGVGLTDGEGVERLWSYLREFSRSTKEMGPEKRIDALTDALIYYGEQLSRKFGKSLRMKLAKANSLLTDSSKKLQELMASLLVPCDEQTIKEWRSVELETIMPKENLFQLSWEEKYVELLLEFKKLRNDLTYANLEEQDRVDGIEKRKRSREKQILSIEKRFHVRCRWEEGQNMFESTRIRLCEKKSGELKLCLQRMASERMFLLELKKKYADGQSIAIKLSKNVNKVTDQMKKSLLTYNNLTSKSLKFEDIKDPLGEIYSTGVESSQSQDVPLSVKRELVETLCIKERSQEEIDLVKREMVYLIRHLLHQIGIIDNFLESMTDTSRLSSGLRAFLRAKKLAIEKRHEQIAQMWDTLKVSPYCYKSVQTFACISDNPTLFLDVCDSDDSDDFELFEERDQLESRSWSEGWESESD